MQRMFTMFHETFALSRPAIAQILQVVREHPPRNGQSIRTLLREHTDLGTNYCKAMPRYAYACGLVDYNCTHLTPFGNFVLNCDPTMARTETQWLMHYHLSAPEGPGPLFWYRLVTEFLQQRESFTIHEIADAIRDSVEAAENKLLQPRSARATATIFLGSYAKPQGLSALRLLQREDEPDSWRFCLPESAPWSVVGYALMRHWDALYPEQKTVPLNHLTERGLFASVFWMGERALLNTLEPLRNAGYIDLYLTAPPHQVVRLREDSDQLLEVVYGESLAQTAG